MIWKLLEKVLLRGGFELVTTKIILFTEIFKSNTIFLMIRLYS